jgi:hypothetical protein
LQDADQGGKEITFMAPTKVLATIFAVAVLVKLTLIICKPDLWMKLLDLIMKKYVRTMVIYMMLAAIVGYYVLTTIHIIDVAAVMLFTSLLIGVSLAPYSTSLLKLREDVMSVGIGKAWLPMLIWGILALWVLYAVFV